MNLEALKTKMNSSKIIELVESYKAHSKDNPMTDAEYREQQINFVVGNSFDVFPTKNVINRDTVIAVLNKKRGI